MILATGFLFILSGCETGTTETPATGSPNTANVETSDISEQNTSLSGSVTIEGSSTVEPISNRAKEKFNEQFPNVNISVSGQGTGNGFKAIDKYTEIG